MKASGLLNTIAPFFLGDWSKYVYAYVIETDVCSSLESKYVLDYEDVMACYRSSKFNPIEANNIIETLQDQMKLSSIADFLKDNTEPRFTYNIDVEKDLQNFKSQNFSSDFDFHYTLTKYFKKLQEGHTEYYKPKYDKYRFELPIALDPYHDEGKVILKVAKYRPRDDLNDEWYNRGFRISKYIDDTVEEIEGIPAIKYIQKFGDEFIGTSRDPNFRFRYALARKTNFLSNHHTHIGLFTTNEIPPNNKSISVSFKNNGKVDIPYLVLKKSRYGTGFGFEDETSFESTIVSLSQESKKNSSGKEHNPKIYIGRYIKIYHLKDAAVMYIPEFPLDPDSIISWDSELYNASMALKESRIQKLVFDMSNNIGGAIRASYDLLRYFFPASREQTYPAYVNNKPLLKEYTKREIKILKNLTSITEPHYLVIDLINGINETIHFIESKENSEEMRISIPLTEKTSHKLNDLMSDTPPVPLNSIALVSNGICISACALFANWIQEMTEIPTYHMGNFLMQPASIGSGIGGSGTHILNNVEYNEVPLTFKQLGPEIDFSMTVIGFYSHTKPNQALDFTWLPAKYNINVTELDIDNQVRIWAQIIDKIPN